ncbi:sensor histidine kinase [Streptomyces sp. NBC_01012]|uniref:sensor histidine kinase n=1 Tax=Streptomyces sp. NBC_01012 TaxID=2903717 RepID=UPI003865F63C|nr:ATP-binding protein [Streptomyces sp. NBC_01012]
MNTTRLHTTRRVPRMPGIPLGRVPLRRISLSRIPFRSRLALAFGGLFLLAGTSLLAFVVLLARYGTAEKTADISVSKAPVDPDDTASPPADWESAGAGGATSPYEGHTGSGGADGTGNEAVALIRETVHTVQTTALQQMLFWSVIGLVLMTVIAALTGRWLAGRALRPVSAVTETALRMSERSLDQRLDLSGPDDELHRLADAFDSMMDRLQRSFDSQHRFVANASHELRTPLAVQRACIEVGLADPLPDDLAETRDDLLTTNREAERLIASLLLLARSDRGLERTEEVELAELTDAATADLRHLAKEKGLALHTEFDAPARVTGEPVLLRHLISNLVGNALRYNRPDGRVDVRLHGRTLTVTNTGLPVDPERVEGLFEPFRRLGQDRTGTTGHGLGLSIVRSIARAHGTDPHAEPGPDGGLRVTVRFT